MKAWKQKLLSDYIYLLVIVLFLYWIIVYGYPLFEYKRNSLIFCNGHQDVVGSFPSQYTFCCLPFCHLLQKNPQIKRNNGLMLWPKRDNLRGGLVSCIEMWHFFFKDQG